MKRQANDINILLNEGYEVVLTNPVSSINTPILKVCHEDGDWVIKLENRYTLVLSQQLLRIRVKTLHGYVRLFDSNHGCNLYRVSKEGPYLISIDDLRDITPGQYINTSNNNQGRPLDGIIMGFKLKPKECSMLTIYWPQVLGNEPLEEIDLDRSSGKYTIYDILVK